MPTKRKPAPPVPRLELPKTFKASDGELAVLSRLVRVMRQRDCRGAPWLGLFIEWLLYRENWNTQLTYQSSEAVFADLKKMGGDDGGLFASSATFLRAARKQCPGITFVSATSAAKPSKQGKPQWDTVMLPPDDEDQFFEILRLWRKEHPEPPKRREFPKGRTQHEMDPDSD